MLLSAIYRMSSSTSTTLDRGISVLDEHRYGHVLDRFYSSCIFDRNVLSVIREFVSERPIEIDADRYIVKYKNDTLCIPPGCSFEYVNYDIRSIELTADIITGLMRGSQYADLLPNLKEKGIVILVKRLNSADAKGAITIHGRPTEWKEQIKDYMCKEVVGWKNVRLHVTTEIGDFQILYRLIPAIVIRYNGFLILCDRIISIGTWLWYGRVKYNPRERGVVSYIGEYACDVGKVLSGSHIVTAEQNERLINSSVFDRHLDSALNTTYLLSNVAILGESILKYTPVKIDILRARFFGVERNYISRMRQRQSPMWSDWSTDSVIRELFNVLRDPDLAYLDMCDREIMNETPQKMNETIQKIMNEATQKLNYIFDDSRVQYPFGYLQIFSQVFPKVRFVLYLDQIPDDKLTKIHQELIDVYNPIRERYDQNKHMALKGVALLNDRLFISDLHCSMYALRYVIEINSVSGEYVIVRQKNKCSRCFKNHEPYRPCYTKYVCDMCYSIHYPGDFKKHICATCNVAFYSTECLVAHRATYCAAPKWCVKCNKRVEYSDLCRLYGHYH